METVLALDQGTTSSRAILFDRQGSILGLAQKEFTQHFPQPGWVEHDPEEIWSSQRAVARQVVDQAGIRSSQIAAIGITNQRETVVVWDRQSGRCLYPAIVWQDRRTAGLCDQLKQAGHSQMILDKTGLVIDAYFSASKIRWILDNVPHARSAADLGELACGTVDSWLLWRMTGGRLHQTDCSNASRTMLYNLKTGNWDSQLLDLFQIPTSMLPEVVPSSMVYGQCAQELLGSPVPIASLAGDQQSALFGQNCTELGMAKNTYGTGCFMLMHIGPEPRLSRHRLLTTSTCRPSASAGLEFALEGSVFIAGAAVQWLRDGLGIIRQSSEVESLASSVPDSDGVFLVPAFAGLGAPHWDPYARGTMIGITRGTQRGHLARAALDGIALQVADVLDCMQQDSGIRLQQLRVDGGASANNLLMQIQADLVQCPVVRPKIVETTALGAAFLAGLAVGFWSDAQEVRSIWQSDRVFEPRISSEQAASYRQRWAKALERSRNWDSPTASA